MTQKLRLKFVKKAQVFQPTIFRKRRALRTKREHKQVLKEIGKIFKKYKSKQARSLAMRKAWKKGKLLKKKLKYEVVYRPKGKFFFETKKFKTKKAAEDFKKKIPKSKYKWV